MSEININQNENTCTGFCGMNYCDENGCLERVRYFTKEELLSTPKNESEFSDEFDPSFDGPIQPHELFLFAMVLFVVFVALIVFIYELKKWNY